MGENKKLQLRWRLELVSGLRGFKGGRLCQSLEGLRLGESGGCFGEVIRDRLRSWSRTHRLGRDRYRGRC